MINGGLSSAMDGPVYGAGSGRTNGGFGNCAWPYDMDGVDLLANGSLNYDTVFGFSYTAIHEMTVLDKAFTKVAMGMDNNTKLYSILRGVF